MSDTSIKAKTAAYLLLKKEIEDRKEMQDALKKELAPYLDAAETNARGSHVIPFEEPLEIDGVRYASLQRVKKYSKVLDEDAVVEWAYANLDERTRDELIVTVQHVNHDVLWDLYARDVLTQEEHDSFYETTITWAFSPTKE